MGFSNEENGGGRYINFKKGTMVNNGKTYKSFEGELVELEIKPDKYEDKPYQKLILYLWDASDEQMYEMQMSMTSGYGFSFFAMVPNLNPGVPMKFSVGMNELEGGNKSGTMFIKQEGKNIKWYYSKNNQKALDQIPKPKELKKATSKAKAILDYTDRDNFIEKVLTAFQTKKLSPLYPKGAAGFKSKAQTDSSNKNPHTPEDVTEPIDDLPF